MKKNIPTMARLKEMIRIHNLYFKEEAARLAKKNKISLRKASVMLDKIITGKD